MTRIILDDEEYKVFLTAVAMSESIQVQKTADYDDWRHCTALYYVDRPESKFLLCTIDFDKSGVCTLSTHSFKAFSDLLNYVYMSKRFRKQEQILTKMSSGYLRTVRKGDELLSSLKDFAEYCDYKREDFLVSLNSFSGHVKKSKENIIEEFDNYFSRGYVCVDVQTNRFSNASSRITVMSISFRNEEEVAKAVNGYSMKD